MKPILFAALLIGWALPAACAWAAEAAQQFSSTITKKVGAQYLMVTPAGYNPSQKYPLIVFLHGKGEQGSDLDRVKIHGPYKKVAEMGLPVIIAAPQSPVDEWWDPDTVAALTRHLIDTLPIDPKRVYLTGLSMGGFGTWHTAIRYPELFAAIAPICGGGQPSKAARLQGMPIWAFHGLKDVVVRPTETTDMVDALNAAGIEVKTTLYPEANHDSWTETYNNSALYDWMLSKRK